MLSIMVTTSTANLILENISKPISPQQEIDEMDAEFEKLFRAESALFERR